MRRLLSCALAGFSVLALAACGSDSDVLVKQVTDGPAPVAAPAPSPSASSAATTPAPIATVEPDAGSAPSQAPRSTVQEAQDLPHESQVPLPPCPSHPDYADDRVCDFWGMPDEAYDAPGTIVTPTGNIYCYGGTSGISCRVLETNFTPKRNSSGSALGATISTSGSGQLNYVSGKPAAGDYATFEYGETMQVAGRVACGSAFEGVTCWNVDNGHGFFVSRQDIDVW